MSGFAGEVLSPADNPIIRVEHKPKPGNLVIFVYKLISIQLSDKNSRRRYAPSKTRKKSYPAVVILEFALKPANKTLSGGLSSMLDSHIAE